MKPRRNNEKIWEESVPGRKSKCKAPEGGAQFGLKKNKMPAVPRAGVFCDLSIHRSH